MARGFGATLGAGAGDLMTAAYQGRPTLFSFFARIYRNGAGGSSNGRIFENAVSTGLLALQFFTGTTYAFVRGWNTTNGIWTIADDLGTGAWTSLAVVYDGGATTNDPLMYLNGTSRTVTETSGPAGSLVTTAGNIAIGNRLSDSARVWDGMLADFAFWDVLIAANDVDALHSGVSPLEIRAAALQEYQPMVRSNVNLVGAAPTINSGTAVQPHPRAMYPRRRDTRRFTTAAAGGFFARHYYDMGSGARV